MSKEKEFQEVDVAGTIAKWFINEDDGHGLKYDIRDDIARAYENAGYGKDDAKLVHKHLAAYKKIFDANFDKYWDDKLSSWLKEEIKSWIDGWIEDDEREIHEFCATHFDDYELEEEAQGE